MEWSLGRRAQTRRGEIAWERFGDGFPVVLTHGTPSRSLVWRQIASSLAESHEVYVWDLLGFGDSERHVDQDVSLVAHGEVLAELVERWELDRPALVGHDIGGAVSLRTHLLEGVAVSHLGLVDAVVLAPWITPRTREMQRGVGHRSSLPDAELERSIIDHLRTATVTRLADDVFRGLFGQWEGAEGQALYIRNFEQFDEEHTRAFEPLLSTISVPTAVIWGEQDAWLPVEVGDRVAAGIPDATFTVLPAAGHFSPEDDPAGVRDGLIDLLNRR